MQKHCIQARGKRRFRVTTTDSKHILQIATNVLDRNFIVGAPNLAWVGDLIVDTDFENSSSPASEFLEA
jgi:hypothetical protein